MKNKTKLKTVLSGAVITLFFIVLTCVWVHAAAIVITDEYIGGTPSQKVHKYYDQDVIGDPDYFDVSQMAVNYDPFTENLSICIASAYFDNVGKYGTTLGDLFISDDGWKPFGITPYYFDNMLVEGEDWEYAIVFDDHTANSGLIGLHAIDKSDIIMSNSLNNSHVDYRKFQEVMVKDKVSEALETGTWFIDGENLYLEINASEILGAGDIEALGFHWTMSCANDVIEGEAAMVPEPSTLILVATGFMGMLAMRARKNQGL